MDSAISALGGSRNTLFYFEMPQLVKTKTCERFYRLGFLVIGFSSLQKSRSAAEIEIERLMKSLVARILHRLNLPVSHKICG
jgi:hypothetical protein